MTTIPVNTPAIGVRTPHLDLSAEREKEPVAGYALKSELNMFVTPIAMSSWFGSILYPLMRPKAEMGALELFEERKTSQLAYILKLRCVRAKG